MGGASCVLVDEPQRNVIVDAGQVRQHHSDEDWSDSRFQNEFCQEAVRWALGVGQQVDYRGRKDSDCKIHYSRYF